MLAPAEDHSAIAVAPALERLGWCGTVASVVTAGGGVGDVAGGVEIGGDDGRKDSGGWGR